MGSDAPQSAGEEGRAVIYVQALGRSWITGRRLRKEREEARMREEAEMLRRLHERESLDRHKLMQVRPEEETEVLRKLRDELRSSTVLIWLFFTGIL